MKSLSTYIQESIKDKLTHFIHKALLPDTTVKTKDYIRDIFEVIIDKSKYEGIKTYLLNLQWHKTKDLINNTTFEQYVIWEWKDVKKLKGFCKPNINNWDVDDIKDNDYVIPYAKYMNLLDSGNRFTILPLVIDKDSLYSMGAAYRDGKIIKSKEDIYKYIVKPAEDVI